MRDLVYYNDTDRDVSIHPGIDERIKFGNVNFIPSRKMVHFSYPKEFTPILKSWDYGGDKGLQIIILLVDMKTLSTMK